MEISLGLPNLNMKRKTKRILVVVVKWRHRANGLFLNFECTFCGFLSRRCKNVENVYETFVNTIEHTECTSSFFRNLAFLVGLKQAKRSDPPWRKQLLLTVFGRCEQYTIDSMVYMIGNEAARATGHLQAANKLFIDTSELKTNGIHGYPKTK